MNEGEKRNQAALQSYLAEKVAEAAEAGEIAPPLYSFVHGDSREAIDQSLQRAREKSQQLVQRARGMAQPPTGFTQHVQEGVSDLDAQAIRDLSLPEYIRRREALGTAPKSTLEFLGGF